MHVIGNVFMLTQVRNGGAAFNLGGTSITIVFTLIAAGVVIYILRTARNLRSTAWAITLGLLLGGATGNLIDRIFRAPGPFRGNVVDWIEVTRTGRYSTSPTPASSVPASWSYCWPCAASAWTAPGALPQAIGVGQSADAAAERIPSGPEQDYPKPNYPESSSGPRTTAMTCQASASSRCRKAWTASGLTPRWPGCSACPGPGPRN